ncbi:MAG TPA: 2-hydroxyacyl-CoA dehydratase [Nitrospirota bacterium]
MEKVGFTTTIPVEAVFAGGHRPIDLNNIFIMADDPAAMLEVAEAEGLPRTTCGWIKGLYISAREVETDAIIAVTQGDCSNTHALMELWQADGRRIIPFAFPYDRDRDLLKLQVHKLIDALGTTEEATIKAFDRLRSIRAKLRRLDALTVDGKVTGAENHIWLVSSSDMNGDADIFEAELDLFLTEAGKRDSIADTGTVRLAYIGVPPIFNNLYEILQGAGGHVVLNEVQRQFSMPYDSPDLYSQYAKYTYPYDVFGRIADIKEQAALRHADGVIHYCQSFCFRAMEDLLIRRGVKLPMLTIEGDRPGPVDARTRIRLEGFVEMLRDRKERR